MMTTDTEIVDWLTKNLHRLLVSRGRMGVLRFSWGTRDDKGQYHWRTERYETLREAVSAAIGEEQKV